MYIQKRSITVILRVLVGLISVISLGVIASMYGPYAVRIFPAWVLTVSSIYFPVSAIVIALNPKKFSGKVICPMLEGLLLVNFFLMSGIALASNSFQFYLPELPGWLVWLICLVLPLIALLDWLLFIKKGAWRPISPLYWLSLPVCYAATMIFLSQILPDETTLRFPLEIFNYLENGLLSMFGWIFIIMILTATFSYLLYLIDYAMSGKLSQKILLPHLQVVEVDEDGNEIVIDSPRLSSVKPTQSEVAATSESESVTQPQATLLKPAKTPPQPEVASTKNSKTSKTPKNSQNSTKSKTKTSSKPKTQKTPQPEIIKVEVTKTNHTSNPKNAQNLHSHNIHNSESKKSNHSKSPD